MLKRYEKQRNNFLNIHVTFYYMEYFVFRNSLLKRFLKGE